MKNRTKKIIVDKNSAEAENNAAAGMKSRKQRIFEIIQIGNRKDIPSMVFDIIISILILLCVTVTFLQTYDSLRNLPILRDIETFTIFVFIIEYCLRLYTADLLYPDLPPKKAVWKFVFSFFGMVDLLSIVSYFVPFMFTSGVVALRMLRVIRIARLFQLSAGYDAFDVILDVLNEKKEQIFSSLIMIVLLMFMSSMLMYSIEHDAQQEAFANGFSGLWWAVSTILTVGYGDIYPITTLGKIMAIVIAFLGVGLVAMPTGIISAGFVEYYHRTNTDTGNAAIRRALQAKQEAQPLVNGCCPLCDTYLEKMKPAFCPVCGQKLACQIEDEEISVKGS